MKESDRLVTVVDPELPAWLVATIEDFAPRVIDYYGPRLGPGETRRPTIMASWYGPNPTHTSLSGSVLPGLITASFEGKALLTEELGHSGAEPLVHRSRGRAFLAGPDGALRARAGFLDHRGRGGPDGCPRAQDAGPDL